MIHQQIRSTIIDYIFLIVGSIIGAISVIVFLAPFDVAPSGVSGIAVIMNELIGTPIGLAVLIMNIPIQIIGYRFLPGGWRIITRTIFCIVIYTLALDYLEMFVPTDGVGDDVLLNTLFGGVTGGISGGMIFRAGGSLGGTSTFALILQRRMGTPMSTTFLYTDVLIIGAAGLVFGWEQALFAIVALFIGGVATDYVMEGPSVIRTATIVTDKRDEVASAVLHQLGRGVTGWEVTGMYTGQQRYMLFVTISRSQMPDLRRLVAEVDRDAFVVIGQGHAAYGEGFKRSRP